MASNISIFSHRRILIGTNRHHAHHRLLLWIAYLHELTRPTFSGQQFQVPRLLTDPPISQLLTLGNLDVKFDYQVNKHIFAGKRKQTNPRHSILRLVARD